MFLYKFFFSVLLKASVCLKWRLMKLKLVRVYSWTSSRISWGIHYLYSAVSFTPGLEIEICIFYCYVRALLTTYWGLKPLVPHNGNLALLMFRKRNMFYYVYSICSIFFRILLWSKSKAFDCVKYETLLWKLEYFQLIIEVYYVFAQHITNYRIINFWICYMIWRFVGNIFGLLLWISF